MTIPYSIRYVAIFIAFFASVCFADDHTHFNTEAAGANVVLAVSFRSDAEIDRHTAPSYSPNTLCDYDATMDAAAMRLPSGTTYISTQNQVRPGWATALANDDGEEMWIQFEVYWPSDWAADDLGGLETYKAFQIGSGALTETASGYYFGNGDRSIEARTRFSLTDGTAVALLDFRTYMSSTDGDNNGEIRYPDHVGWSSYDYQPGGDTWVEYGSVYTSSSHLAEYPTAFADRSTNINPYMWLPDTWNRITIRITNTSGVERCTVWAANETTGPVKVLANPDNPAIGYKMDSTHAGYNQFWFEFNSSQESRTAEQWYIYFRNLIVSTSEIDYSGNPGSGAAQTTFYVDADAGGGGDGTIGTPYTFAEAEAAVYSAGNIIYFQKGDDFTSSGVFTLDDNGTAGNYITLSAYGTGNNPKLAGIELTGNYTKAESLDIDGEATAAYDLVSVDGANVVVDSCEIHHGLRDGVDIGGGTNPTISNTTVHHMLNGHYGADPIQDAHGITGNIGSSTVTISNYTCYFVSGDCIQFDPDRLSNGSTINATNATMYSGALTEDFNGTCPNPDAPTTQGWCTGNKPGENAIDTKIDNTDPYTQTMTWNLTNIIAYGWDDLSVNPANRAAFNLKENITVTLNRVMVYNNEIAFRVRGGNGNADITIKSAVIHSNDVGVRAEDELQNLEIFNCTFGDNVDQYYETNQSGHTGWDLRNNAFLGTKDVLFTDSTNISASSGDFVNSTNDDYRLSVGSSLIGVGATISEVQVDYSNNGWSAPYDSGAYKFMGTAAPTASGIGSGGVTMGVSP